MFGLTPYSKRNFNNLINFDNIFERFFNDSIFNDIATINNPIKADIKETDTEYIVEAEIPGVDKKDINLTLKNDILNISVEKNTEITDAQDNYLRKERYYGSFSRGFHIEGVKNEKVDAKYENGILTIILPKEETKIVKNYNIDIN